MDLTVIVPTFRRPRMLEKTLASLTSARIPSGMQVEICVVDNNSQDETPLVVEQWRNRVAPPLSVRYIFEPQPGSSQARNAGIRATSSPLIGTIDDDEEVAPQWIEVARQAFEADPGLAFIGGPYLPNWEHEPPAWLPIHDFPAVIGWVEAGPVPRDYGPDYPGILMGGNGVIRREWFDRVGLYATNMGPVGTRLTRGEDDDLYWRLLAAGARGRYLPDLAIDHWVPTARMTKRYFRNWAYWNARSTVRFELNRAEPKLLGLARWRYRLALRGLLLRAKGLLRPGELRSEEFAGELHAVALAGLLAGRWGKRK